MGQKYLIINDNTGGPAILLPVQESGGVFIVNGISVSGLGLTTAGVSDSLDKRFVTDDELAALQDFSNGATEALLVSVPGVDLNSATPNSLYTVPAAKQAIITKIVVRDASISLTTVSFSVGFNDPDFDNVIADDTHTELSAASLYTVLQAMGGATRGTAGEVLSLLCNILQGAAATCTIDVFGYLAAA